MEVTKSIPAVVSSEILAGNYVIFETEEKLSEIDQRIEEIFALFHYYVEVKRLDSLQDNSLLIITGKHLRVFFCDMIRIVEKCYTIRSAWCQFSAY